jgi:hypothetical protein
MSPASPFLDALKLAAEKAERAEDQFRREPLFDQHIGAQLQEG